MADDIRRWSDELARDPASLVFLQLGEALRRQGQVEVALKIALRGLERHPRSADAHDLVARIAVDRRDFPRAFEEWETVLRIAPTHLGAMKGLGYISFQQGHFEAAEKFLSRAAAGGGGPDVTNALQTVRRTHGAAGATSGLGAAYAPQSVSAEPVPRPADSELLFSDLLVDDGQAAMVLDGSGYVLAGVYRDDAGKDVSQDVGAQLSGISDEVRRSTRHLDIGNWKSITFETQAAVVAMAPGADDSLIVVAGRRTTPLGLLRRLLDRCVERASEWLGTGDRR
jgi:predicted regulator of Ras-like GTPase activity (Roadblock/LC7/MglB family)